MIGAVDDDAVGDASNFLLFASSLSALALLFLARGMAVSALFDLGERLVGARTGRQVIMQVIRSSSIQDMQDVKIA